MKRKTTAAMFSILIVFTLASCGKKAGQTATEPGSPETSAVTQAVSATKPATEPETVAETSAEAAANDTSADRQTTAAAENGAPRGVAEIVDYFNEAVNRTKEKKPGYTLTVTNRADKDKINIADNKALNAVLPGIVASAINAESNNKTVTVNPRVSHAAFPPKGSNPAALTANAVKSAFIYNRGSGYEIVLQMKDERLDSLPADPHQTKHGKAFNMISLGEFKAFTGKIPGVEILSFQPLYNASEIRCEIDKAAVILKKATYILNTFASAEISVLRSGKLRFSAEMEYSVQEEYIIG